MNHDPTSGTRAPTVQFDRHLEGAVPGYANGGVVAGTLASHLDGRGDHVATTWMPPADLADATGQLPAAPVWAALDCPSWYGGARGAPALLGTITARQHLPVPATSPVVVSGWLVHRDGRKTMAGSAIHDLDGELLAVASTIWIHPRSTTDE